MVFIFLVVAGVLALVGTTVFASIYLERKRREALVVFARERGWQFGEQRIKPGELPCGHLKLFNIGHGKWASNVMTTEYVGSEPAAAATAGAVRRVMDYRYTVGGGKNSHTSVLTVAAYELPACDFPQFVLQKEHLGHTFASWFGHDDIDFPEHPEFSKHYHLQSPDEAGVRAMFAGPLIEFIQQGPTVTVQAEGSWLIVHQKRAKVEELAGTIAAADTVAEAFALVAPRR